MYYKHSKKNFDKYKNRYKYMYFKNEEKLNSCTSKHWIRSHEIRKFCPSKQWICSHEILLDGIKSHALNRKFIDKKIRLWENKIDIVYTKERICYEQCR